MLNEHELRALGVWYEHSGPEARRPIFFYDDNDSTNVMAADPEMMGIEDEEET